MGSLLNPDRPPVFCPGCSHETVVHALDRVLDGLGLEPHEVVIVSDIGCSGLFDTFLNTHAFHGLHGRALTYAAGIKLARPHLNVIVTMGDGGLGIGGAHLLAACRRNLDLTLLILNNFNFGMTGGQFSCTTPEHAAGASGFLNTLEKPMDVCSVAAASGAPFVARTSAHSRNLTELLQEAIRFQGFSLVDVWGFCTGRYLKLNRLTPRGMEEDLQAFPPFNGPVASNQRPEYGDQYRAKAMNKSGAGSSPQGIEPIFSPPVRKRRELVLLGSAGDRILSAGSLLAHAAILCGMQVTQKNDYNITVMRGPSVSELILAPEQIVYTGVEKPDVIVALSREGIQRRRDLFSKLGPDGRVISELGLELPETAASILEVDFKSHGVKRVERALVSISMLASGNDPITLEVLEEALCCEMKGRPLEEALGLVRRARGLAVTLGQS